MAMFKPLSAQICPCSHHITSRCYDTRVELHQFGRWRQVAARERAVTWYKTTGRIIVSEAVILFIVDSQAPVKQSHYTDPWWRHQMETFSALLAICAGNSPVSGEFPAQRPVTRSFDVFFDLRLNKRLNKQSSGWWFETLSRPLWRHSNA